MLLSEIAEFVVKEYPKSFIAVNNVVKPGLREDWYEDYLIDELMDHFSYEIMDMCGCGSPDYTYEMIRRVLHIRKEWFETDDMPYDVKVKRYEENLHINYENTMNYGMLQFVLYMLDSKGIVEHGSSIGGCFLTELGKMYLTVLDAWHEQNKEVE